MSDDVSSILDGEEIEDAVEDTEELKEVPEGVEATEDKPEEAEGEPPAPEKGLTESERGKEAALVAERQKRQDAQKENQSLKDELNALKNPPKDRPDVFEDTEEAFKYSESKAEKELTDRIIRLSQSNMRRDHNDYDEMEVSFVELTQEDSSLITKMRLSDDPAGFVYDTAKKYKDHQEMQNVDEYKAKLKAEAKQEVLAELKAGKQTEEEDEAKKSEADVPSLANASSMTSGFNTPTDVSVEDLLG